MAETTRAENREGLNPDQVVESAVGNLELAESGSYFEFLTDAKKYFRNKYKEGTTWAEEKKGELKDWAIRESKVSPEGLKDATKEIAKVSWGLARISPSIIFKVVYGVYDFIKTVIKKKGHISYGEGYEIGKEMFNFSAKKEKK